MLLFRAAALLLLMPLLLLRLLPLVTDLHLQDVGIWLETDWYRKQAVVKEIKKDSYAFTSTDIHVSKTRKSVAQLEQHGRAPPFFP